MKGKLLLVPCLLLLLSCLSYARFSQTETKASSSSPVHNLNTGLNYTTIQEAINANETLDGHTIQVDAGTYNEYGIRVNKTLSLVGDGRENTIIVGSISYYEVPTIFVTSDNVNISGFMLRDGWDGILAAANYTHITNCTFTNNKEGIYTGLYTSTFGGNVIDDNFIVNNGGTGIYLSTNNDTIFHNTISDNGGGISLVDMGTGPSSGIHIYENIIENNTFGIVIGYSGNNTIIHNNFIHNEYYLIAPYTASTNNWDNGFEGNYWSDYDGPDNNLDGIGDTPYVVNETMSNIDHHPLMGTFQSFNVSVGGQGPPLFEEVYVISSSMIRSVELICWLTSENQYFKAGQYLLRLEKANDQEGTMGFCRVMVPNDVLNTSDYLVVSSDMTVLEATRLPISNTTHSYLYFPYRNPVDSIYMTIPEFPLLLFPFTFMLITLFLAIALKRKTRKPRFYA